MDGDIAKNDDENGNSFVGYIAHNNWFRRFTVTYTASGCMALGFFAVGHLTIKNKKNLTFFLTANCPTAKNPRTWMYTVTQGQLTIIIVYRHTGTN